MLVTESDLAPIRRGAAPIAMRPPPPTDFPRSYVDYPAYVDRMRKTPRVPPDPTILTSLDLAFTPTDEAFARDWGGVRPAVPVLAYVDAVPVLPPSRTWEALEHQGGGHSVLQTPMIAARIDVLPVVQAAFDSLARRLRFAGGGWWTDADSIPEATADYEATLALLDLSLGARERSLLMESLYPVDGANIVRLTDEPDLVALCTSPVPPILLFLSENSD